MFSRVPLLAACTLAAQESCTGVGEAEGSLVQRTEHLTHLVQSYVEPDGETRVEDVSLEHPSEEAADVALLSSGCILPEHFADPLFSHSCGGEMKVGQSCPVLCSAGYHIKGHHTILQCTKDGLLGAGTMPECTANLCRERKFPKGVTHNCTGLHTGQSCKAWAGEGFGLVSGNRVKTLICGALGNYEGEMPDVVARHCGKQGFPNAKSTCLGDTEVGLRCWAYCWYPFHGPPKAYKCVEGADKTVKLMAEKGESHCEKYMHAPDDPRYTWKEEKTRWGKEGAPVSDQDW